MPTGARGHGQVTGRLPAGVVMKSVMVGMASVLPARKLIGVPIAASVPTPL